MPGGRVTEKAAAFRYGDPRAWQVYSLAIALAPFYFQNSRTNSYCPSLRCSLQRRPGHAASGPRRRTDWRAGAVSSAWSLAWPAGMPSLQWASAWSCEALPNADNDDKYVIFGHDINDRNSVRLVNEWPAIPVQEARSVSRARVRAPGGNALRRPKEAPKEALTGHR
jgi:hypothetical protein